MAMSELFAYQGVTKNYQALQINNNDGLPATGIYTSGSVLSAIIYEGQNQAVIATLAAPTWFTATTPTQTGYGQGQFSLAIAGTFTASLNPAGEYYIQVSQTTGGVTSIVWMGRLKILATPGSTSSSPPDLITLDYAFAAMSELALTDGQRDFVPYLVTAASHAIRKACFNRHFDLRTLTEIYPVSLDGFVRLYQVPVNQVIRVQASPQLALTVQNNSSSVQFAQAYFASTGQFDGYGTNAQTLTGMILNWITSGTLTTTTITFTAHQTIASLATAINAVGSGWSAIADSVLELWPVIELDGGYVAQGCAMNASPSTGASFNVLMDLANCQLAPDGQATGMLWVGRQSANTDSNRWGPGGDSMLASQRGNHLQADAK